MFLLLVRTVIIFLHKNQTKNKVNTQPSCSMADQLHGPNKTLWNKSGGPSCPLWYSSQSELRIHPLLPDYGASHIIIISSYDALPCNSKWIDWFIIFQVEDVVVTVPFPKQVLNVNLTPSGEVCICYVIQ